MHGEISKISLWIYFLLETRPQCNNILHNWATDELMRDERWGPDEFIVGPP